MSSVSSVVFVLVSKNMSFNKQNEMTIPKLKTVFLVLEAG